MQGSFVSIGKMLTFARFFMGSNQRKHNEIHTKSIP